MPASKSDQKAVRKYKENNYDRIELTVLKGKKNAIKEHAAKYQDEVGEIRSVGYSPKGSMNAFINRAIDETIKRDKDGDNATTEGNAKP